MRMKLVEILTPEGTIFRPRTRVEERLMRIGSEIANDELAVLEDILDFAWETERPWQNTGRWQEALAREYTKHIDWRLL